MMANEAGLTAAENVLMSMFVFAGASQIMAVGMDCAGGEHGHDCYGYADFEFAPYYNEHMRHEQDEKCFAREKVNCFFCVTDESFAIFTTIEEKKCTRCDFLGIITVSYSAWIAGTVIGVFASNFLPAIVSNSLDIALYAMFIALLVPHLKNI